MPNRLSWNINASNYPNREYFNDYLRQQQPSTLLIMDGYQTAIDLTAALPNTKIVHRSFSVDDYRFWQTESPQAFVDREVAWGHPEIWRQVLNEPPVGDVRLINWLIDVADLFTARGYKAVLGNFSTGGYEPHHVESGYFDALLRVCAGNHQHTLGVHEYTGILLPYNGMWSTEHLYDKAWAQPEHWRREFPITRIQGKLPEYWHLLRSSWLTLRAQEIGAGKPRYWVTEFGWDALSDLATKGVYDHFKSTYGIPAPHESLRGINTLAPIWRDYYPQWTVQQAAYEQLKWADSIYPDNYVGFNLFTVSGSHDWKIGAGMDYSELTELHELLLTSPTPQPETETNEFPADTDPAWVIESIEPVRESANIRAKPTVIASVVGELRERKQVYLAIISGIPDGNYRWYPIRYGDVRGYVRNDVIKYRPSPPPDEPSEHTLTIELTVNMTGAQFDALQAAIMLGKWTIRAKT